MKSRPLAASLAKRFAIAAAALATAALLLIALSSWWLTSQHHASAVRLLNKKEAQFHASTVSRMLHGIAWRMSEVAQSTILATGLVDSAGRETYLTPYLNSIQQVDGVPVQILFTDFEGKEISSNGRARFSNEQLQWMRDQVEQSRRSAAIFDSAGGPELVAVEPMGYNRTRSAEGALLYKLALKDVQPSPSARLAWDGPGATSSGPARQSKLAAHDVIVPIGVPDLFQPLGLRLVEQPQAVPAQDLAPQYAAIFVIAFALAGGVFVIGARLALTLTRDLRKLEAFSSSVVKEGFGLQRAEASGSREVAGLARSINHMLDRLYEQHSLLQQETQTLHQLANTIPHLAWMADADGWVHWYNDRWYEYTGTTHSQMAGWGWQSAVEPDELPRVMKAWKASIMTGNPFEVTYQLRAASGEYHTFFTRAAPLRDASGNIVQWFGTNTDVTPLEKAEKALLDSQERLKEGMVAARMVVWDWDLATGKVRFSDNVDVLFGGAWEDAASALSAIHPDDVQLVRDAYRQALEEQGPLHAVARLVRPDNGDILWIEVRGKVQCDAAGAPRSISGISLDVTERKRAEEELREADRRKDEFLAMLAHELRNPLAPISAAAQLLKLTQPDEARLNRTSDIIARQAEHMTRLVDDLLDVSRVTRGLVTLENEALEVGHIVSDAVEQVRPLLEARRHELSVQLPSGPVRVLGDQKRLVQVLANLLANAGKYTPDGGRIALQIEATSDQVALSVTDNGIGIAPKMLPRVFDLFAQAERSSDRSQGGLGLGLALVKSLVELHRGAVIAHSRGVGQGATFTIQLPRLAEPGAVQTLPAAAAAPAAPQPALRLMIVDDNHDAAHSLAMFLQAGGHEVLVESDPFIALERIRAERPAACLLDIGLPGMDGNELARRLRALPETADTVLIAITGYGQEYDRQAALAAGFDHYFVKPADTAKLTALLAGLGEREAAERGA